MKIYSSIAPDTEDVGLADNDIDGFLKNLLSSVNRESAQNSNDEADSRPVRMNFDLGQIPVSDIPDIEKYRDVVERCLAEADEIGAAKAQEFFGNAKRVLSEETVDVLSISDEGTKGAGGEFKKGGKFYTLTVSKGRTEKANLFSAGSFGIGKNAAFAGSQLRTVFYSSAFNNAPNFYALGKSVFTSWTDEGGKNMNHKIFFSSEDGSLTPETDQTKLPEWLQKDAAGLKVSILAPRIELRDDWKHGYIASLLSNFFVAIYDGNLEFALDNGSVRLNKSTMLDYFDEAEVIAVAEQSGEDERLSWAKACSEAFLSNEFISETVNVAGLGEFEILINVAEGLPKKVCIVRNGMFITDTLNHFGKPLKRFPSTKDFIVVVRPKAIDDPASAAIKRMENPEHSELTTSFIADETEVGALNRAMKELEEKVRGVIGKHARMEISASRDIEELREYFDRPGGEHSDYTETEEVDPTEITVTRNDRKSSKAKSFQEPGKSTGGGGYQA